VKLGHGLIAGRWYSSRISCAAEFASFSALSVGALILRWEVTPIGA
jgi:hypothetical protein